MAERAEDRHSRDGDERQDERVLHHRLTLLLIPKSREREVHPRRDLLRLLHLVPPLGGSHLPASAARLWELFDVTPRIPWLNPLPDPSRLPATRRRDRSAHLPGPAYRSALISLKIDETDPPSVLRMATAATETSA